MRARLGLLIVACAALAGCGTSDDRDQARTTVERFYDAVRAERGLAACAQLTGPAVDAIESQSGRPCRAVITRLEYGGGAIVRTQVAVNSAKVDTRTGESAFLEREPEGWRISAAGCRPVASRPRDEPWDCEAEG
jgi:hypothetical protein